MKSSDTILVKFLPNNLIGRFWVSFGLIMIYDGESCIDCFHFQDTEKLNSYLKGMI